MNQLNFHYIKHTLNMLANINKYSTLTSFSIMFLIFFTENSFAQKEIDTLYLYSDTVKFYNKTAFVTDDVCGLSLKFISPENWEEYYINQILVVIPDSIEISEESFTISIGNFPRDSIIYTKSVNMYPSFPEFHSFEFNPPPLIKKSTIFFLV